MRVLHVGKFYPPVPGGMERVVQLLCEGALATTDSRVLVANTSLGTSRGLWHGVQVTRISSLGRIGSVAICPTFPLELLRSRRDVTVIHEPNPLALVSDWVTAQTGPLVVWFHSEVLRPAWKYRLLYRPFLRRVLRRAARIVVSSPRLAEHASELRDFREKCVVIPFGIDTARLARVSSLEPRIAEIDRRHPGSRVLFVGRLVAYKGIDVLVRAMGSVDGTALVVGDGPLRSTLEAEAVVAGTAGKVKFLGQLSDEEVLAHLHACDLFVLPSVTSAETFGMAQLEAMACGKAVVSTNLPTGVPWVNRHGETGLVVPAGDADALASALNALLADSTLRRRMGQCGRRRVDEEFTVEHMASRAVALYEQVAVEAAARVSMRDHAGRPASSKRDAQ